MRYNTFNQPIGDEVESFKEPNMPNVGLLEGKYSKLEHLNESHIDQLFLYYVHQKMMQTGRIYLMNRFTIKLHLRN